MTTQQNKERARRVFDEIWSQGRLELADDFLSSDFVARPGGVGDPFKGRKEAKEFIGRLREGFPDIRFEVEDMIAEGDVVAARWSALGTHEGEFMGFEPTERRARIGGMTFLRFEDGTIVEGWTQLDTLALMNAVGAVRDPVEA